MGCAMSGADGLAPSIDASATLPSRRPLDPKNCRRVCWISNCRIGDWLWIFGFMLFSRIAALMLELDQAGWWL